MPNRAEALSYLMLSALSSYTCCTQTAGQAMVTSQHRVHKAVHSLTACLLLGTQSAEPSMAVVLQECFTAERSA